MSALKPGAPCSDAYAAAVKALQVRVQLGSCEGLTNQALLLRSQCSSCSLQSSLQLTHCNAK